MVYTSLTEAPHNLKEGIDWLMALKGTSDENNLMHMVGTIHHLFSDHSAGNNPLPSLDKIKSISKEFLEKPELRDNMLVRILLSRFYTPASAANTGSRHYWHRQFNEYGRVVGVKGAEPEYIKDCLSNVMDGFGKLLDDIKTPDQYESSYSSEATWEASCAKNPEACAVVLVGIAPMLYAGLISLWGTTESKTGEFHRYAGSRSFGEVLRALGYVQPQCRSDINGSEIFKNFKGLDDDLLHNTYDLAGFDVFYGSKTPVPEKAEPSAESTLRAKVRKFYMGSREVYGIPGVDVDMGLVNAWNSKTYHNKRPKISTASATGNFQSPGAPTVANMDAASPF
ncbi:hypothetical protein BBBOND_0204330 [Babesia bigemina]|uniref:Uncharacterized protein n=1 Tax=Babesia bigemina TaxID=5866 RepID=A0A061DBZ4_BABBI|nr:hypothetical protein BBBOND_0204330 [Babesia bigemina]CDR95275.1 hypothetical protein BBBOND_0204330 [Babesia bigemina]|eukprot:XP_012767461.1 hypothetical protein BBBOND_0204330 [Babesia bigemina]